MGEICTRSPETDELPLLKSLWRETFGTDGLETFFATVRSTEQTIIALQEDTLAAMGYIIDAGELAVPAGIAGSMKCAMLYAIAVKPEHRGKGLGSAVTRALVERAYESGFDAAVTCPSQDSLFDYYNACTGMREWFYTDEKRISAASTVKRKPGRQTESADMLAILTPEKYNTQREKLLGDICHIKYTPACTEYQAALCREQGGGLYGIGSSCVAVECGQDSSVCIKELLLSKDDNEQDVIAAVNSAYPADSLSYRQPALQDGAVRAGMLCVKKGTVPVATGVKKPWYGFYFD